MLEKLMGEQKKILIVDGICNLCNAFVRIAIRWEKGDQLRFVPRQSDLGQSLMMHLEIDPQKFDTILLIDDSTVYYKSKAIFKTLPLLRFPLSALRIFRFLPIKFTDRIYDWVATNRYKWFGSKDRCDLMTPERSVKFL
jgi:predicted DCC family thiol-disulfide oxidoreductase YuxK